MNMRITSLVLAVGIALFGGISLAAGMQPPIYPVPPIIVLIAFLGSITFAAAQTQVSSWKDSKPEIRAGLDEMHARLAEGLSAFPVTGTGNGTATDRVMGAKPPPDAPK